MLLLLLLSCYMQVTNLQVQEAMLTGESVPISKNLIPVAEASGLGDRKCMAFSATTVSAGQGLGVVVATGERAAQQSRLCCGLHTCQATFA